MGYREALDIIKQYAEEGAIAMQEYSVYKRAIKDLEKALDELEETAKKEKGE